MRTLLIVAFAMVAVCQPKDVDGWGPVHWGMTVDEAAKVTGGVVIEKSVLLNRKVVATGDYGEVSMGTLRHSNLVRVIMVIPEAQNTPASRDTAFQALRAELVAKYGHPNSTRMYFDLWEFHSTKIQLSTLSPYGEPDAPVNVIFTRRGKK